MRDAAGILGLVLLGAGFWMCAPWLGLAVPGGCLWLMVVVGALRGSSRA